MRISFHPFRRIFRQTVCLVLAACIVETSGGIAHAALLLESMPGMSLAPRVVRHFSDPAYFTERALVNRMVGFHRPMDAPLGGTEALSFGHLALEDGVLKPLQAVPERSAVSSTVSIIGIALTSLLFNYLLFHFMAVPSGVALGCGNLIIGGFRPLLQLVEGMSKPVRRLAGRGIQSLGAVTMLPYSEKVPKDDQIPGYKILDKVTAWKLAGRKEWFFKREDAIQRFFGPFSDFIRRELGKSVNENPERASTIKLHSRFATTGSKDQEVDELIHAAQPSGLPGHWALRWQVVDTPQGPEQKPAYVWVEHSFQFNGDVNKTRRLQFKMDPDHMMGNQALRDFLMQWMNVRSKDVPSGDAPLVGMLQELFFTQGLWGASMRYALAIHVASPADTETPPLEALKRWEPLFHHAYQEFITDEHPEMKTLASLDQASDAQADAFAQYLEGLITNPDRRDLFLAKMHQQRSDRGMSAATFDEIQQMLGPHLHTFLRASSFAFFRNSLPYAVMYEILPRIEGTTGGDFSSTLNPPGSPDMHVTICFGQGIVVAFSKDGRFFSTSSDRSVQKLMPAEDAYEKLVLDFRMGEVLVLGLEKDKKLHIALYAGPDKVALSEETIRQRLKPMNDPVDGDRLDAPPDPLFEQYPLGAELKRTVSLLKTLHDEWDQAREGVPSRNLQTASEMARLLIQKKIFEAIRSRTGANERDLSEKTEAYMWSEAERLSRDSWAREKDEAELLKAVKKSADHATQLILENAASREDPGAILKKISSTLASGDDEGDLALVKKIAETALSALQLGTDGGSLEQNTYDIVLIGTEKNEYAMEQFGMNLQDALGLRVKSLSGNEFLETADRYRNDIDGFLRAMQIDSKRTLVIVASDSAETFEIGVGGGWAAATVQECFSWTGGKDNRLVDIVEKNRSLHNHNPTSPDEAHLAAYAATLETANELLLFLGENVTSRFQTGGKEYPRAPFFKTPFEAKDFAILRDSNNHFVMDTVPQVLGYTTAGQAIQKAGSDRDKLERLGARLAHRQLESVRVKIIVWSYLFLSVVLAGSGLGGASLLLLHFVGIPTGLTSLIVARLADWIIYGGFGLVSLMAMRWVREKLGWSTTNVLAGFGPPLFLITDSHRYVQQFLALYARTAQGLAYGINSAPFFHTSTLDAVDEFKTASRRWVVLIGRPDGRFDELLFDQAAAEMLGRQLKSILTLPFRWMKHFKIKPVSPEVITFGSYQPDNNAWEAMAQDEHVSFGQQNILRSPDDTPVPAHVVRLYGNAIDAFTRLLGGARFLTTQLQIVSHSFPRFPEDRSHTNTAVKSTAGPAPGDRVLNVLQQTPDRLVTIQSDKEALPLSANPVVIETRPLTSWMPELLLPSQPHLIKAAPVRRATEQPLRRITPLPEVIEEPTPSRIDLPLTLSLRDREIQTLRIQLKHVMRMDPTRRNETIDSLTTQPGDDAAHQNLALLYRKVGESYDKANLSQTLSDEPLNRALERILNNRYRKKDIESYVDSALSDPIEEIRASESSGGSSVATAVRVSTSVSHKHVTWIRIKLPLISFSILAIIVSTLMFGVAAVPFGVMGSQIYHRGLSSHHKVNPVPSSMLAPVLTVPTPPIVEETIPAEVPVAKHEASVKIGVPSGEEEPEPHSKNPPTKSWIVVIPGEDAAPKESKPPQLNGFVFGTSFIEKVSNVFFIFLVGSLGWRARKTYTQHLIDQSA